MIRENKIAEAKVGLLQWIGKDSSELKRNERFQAANIARRLSLPEIGVKLLHPIVRPSEKKSATKALPKEITEYAANLIRLGITNEARKLLQESLVLEQSDETEFILGLLEIQDFNFPAARKRFQNLIKKNISNKYRALLARINLCLSEVWCKDYSSVKIKLISFIEDTKNSPYKLLHINASELLGLLYCETKNYNQAKIKLKYARTLYGKHDQTIDSFLIEKSSIYLLALEEPDSKKVLIQKNELTSIAKKFQFFNVYRDMELKFALATQNKTILEQVYFPTKQKKF